MDTYSRFILKDTILDFSPYLSHKEFKCRCSYKDCKYTLISPKLVSSYAATRGEFNSQIIINSGFRCQKHNDDVGGHSNSRHLIGHAIDLHVKIEKLDQLERIAKKYFDTVLRYDTFIHCHNEPVFT